MWVIIGVLLIVLISLFVSRIDGIVCPHKWVYFDDRCWLMNSIESSWKDAQYDCKNRYFASLVTIQSFEEDHLMSQLSLTGTESLFKMFDRRESTHLKCFNKITDTIIMGAYYISPANIYTPSQCLNECMNAKTRFKFNCRSIMWFRESSECVLNSKSRDELDVNLVTIDSAIGVDFYENECAFDSILANTYGVSIYQPGLKVSNSIPGVRSCFSKYRHSSLVGYVDKIIDNVTERECLSECWRCGEDTRCFESHEVICKSVTYYSSVKQCIMTSKSKKSHPESFDSSEILSDFFERRRDCTYENCEDQEIGLVFVIDGSDAMSVDDFEHSLFLIDKIVTEIHETTEFWRLTIIQLGTQEPSVVEIPFTTFMTLDYMRKELNSIEPRNFTGVRRSESVLEVTRVIENLRENYDLDFVWVLFLTNGFNFEEIGEFLEIKNQKAFSSFAIGIGDDLNFPILEQIATSHDHLIHMQNPEKVAKLVSSKLCANTGVVFTSDTNKVIHSLGNDVKRKPFLRGSRAFNMTIDESVWLGLHREEMGQMSWDGDTEMREYDKNLLKHLEVGVDTGNCILWLGPRKWIQTDCSFKHRYACSLKPLQTINEKLNQLVDEHRDQIKSLQKPDELTPFVS